MRYHVLACDYDETLTTGGIMESSTVEALRRLRESGRKLVLVTGRQLEDVLGFVAEVELFDRIVAENGAVLYRPSSREEQILAEPVHADLVRALRAAGVEPLATGRSIVATSEPHETAVLQAIRDLGLELHVIFNKGSVMVLPSGINKATGLAAALDELGLSPHNAVGIGDAENDHAFLAACECGVAVANALPAVRERADLVTAGDHGAGAVELVERLLATDLAELEPALTRHHVPMATGLDGSEVRLAPYGASVLIAGASGSGKSTLATAVLEGLLERGYQVCAIDPEGDYAAWDQLITVGDPQQAPTVAAVLELLESPSRSASINLLGIPLQDRPKFFDRLLPRLQELRARTGRPHWIVVDEAHHMLPPAWRPGALTQAKELPALMLITVHPEHVAPAVLGAAELVIGVGPGAEQVIRSFAGAIHDDAPPTPAVGGGQAVVWDRGRALPPRLVQPLITRAERRRHVRKYAEGELGPDRSFYFRGAAGKLNLRAHNLAVFLQLADGVDEETWLHHLRHGDYARWFRDSIKDDGLAEEAGRIEREAGLTAAESRARVRAAIEQRYTGAA